MSDPSTNGAFHADQGPGHSLGDMHGRAALILVESLMHALVAKGALTQEEFVDIVELAADVECETRPANSSPSHLADSLLIPLAAAFRQELGR